MRTAFRLIRDTSQARANALLDLDLQFPLIALLLSNTLDHSDVTILLVAIHALCNLARFRLLFVAADGLSALIPLITSHSSQCASNAIQTSSSFKLAETPNPLLDHQPIPYHPNTQHDTSQRTVSHLHHVALRTLAKLMVCCPPACAQALKTSALPVLASAAAPDQNMDIRLRACAGLAAIAAWSGPRFAVQIVDTPQVISVMCAILVDRDDRIPADLRSATIDALVSMSRRGYARRVLKQHGCDEKITIAARLATLSGDYTAAARSTVAAGQLTGRSIDEYGFFVEQEQQSLPNTDEDILHTRRTGLSNIAQQMIDEPYTSFEDLNVLEEIVFEQEGILASSPKERHLLKRRANASSENIECNVSTPLFDSSSPNKQSSQQDSQSLAACADHVEPVIDPLASPGSMLSNGTLVEHAGSASPRRNSNFDDPDFDRLLVNGDETEETEIVSPSQSMKSLQVSPLLMFSSATKEAAKRDTKNAMFRKTNSQITRESKQQNIWKEVIETRLDMLQREHGRSSRVLAYRQLALVPVPSSMRRKLWPILLDTKALRKARPGLYRKLCDAGEGDLLPDDIEHTIDADVTRTMPSHCLFWAGGAQVGVQSLRSILRAYARYAPAVGYCQGMSSIAAVFLMNAVDEEEAFLMLAQFMSRYQYKKVFAPGFPLMLQWISELKPLVAHYMPDLNALLERENVELGLYADKWLITALSHNFPHRHLLRVWDLMFLGGSPKIILKACLAVLKQCEEILMKMEFDTMMPFLQRGFAEAEAGVLDAKNPEPFIAMMREFRFMCDIPKSQLNSVQTASKMTRTEPNRISTQRKYVRWCLPCFKQSATID